MRAAHSARSLVLEKMALTAAEAFRDAACGRVVAMLSKKGDVPETVVRRLADVLDTEPAVVPKPVLRIDACLAMLFTGALGVLVYQQLTSQDGGEADEADEADGEAEEEDDDPSTSSSSDFPAALW